MATIDTIAPSWAIDDEETLNLITSLLLDDVKQLTSAAKGKRTKGTLTDAELALQLYYEELNNAANFASDRQMSRSIQIAIQTDADALSQAEREEFIA